MWTACAFALVGGPFAVVKLLAFDFPRHSAPAVLVLLSSLAFTGLHLAAAHNVVRWARRRADMGLDGFGYPWEVSSPPPTLSVGTPAPATILWCSPPQLILCGGAWVGWQLHRAAMQLFCSLQATMFIPCIRLRNHAAVSNCRGSAQRTILPDKD